MQRLLSQLLPFLLMGIAIVAFALGIMLLAYIFLFGAMLGLILFGVSWVRNKLFPPKSITIPREKPNRIIDSDDFKEL